MIFFTIQIANFVEHNKNRKKGYRYTLIRNNFCSNEKIRGLPLSVSWLYLGLILICGEHNQDTIKISLRSLQDLLKSKLRPDQALDALQSLQLLTWEKCPLIELKRTKDKVTKDNSHAISKRKKSGPKPKSENFELFEPATAVSTVIGPDQTRESWQAYHDAYWARYGDEPMRNAKVNSMLKKFVGSVGESDAPHVIWFYLRHPDALYATKHHPLEFLLRDAQKLRTEYRTGNIVTMQGAKTKERSAANDIAFRNVELGIGEDFAL